MTGKTQTEKKYGLRDNCVYLLAFLVPIFIMTLIYFIRDIYPFGEEMYLRSDMYHQYAPFYRELARKLNEGGSLLYSWDIGMGTNFVSLAAYYLASPFNIILILFNSAHVIEIMSILIILKMGLASLTFTYFLSEKFNTKSSVIAVFGIFYATSSYYAAFSWNIMWLDCMFLLPLIVLGIERLVKENKCILYCISLGVAIFSNYYIAIMLCIFSVIYFIYMMVVTDTEKTASYVIKKFIRFGIFSAIAGGLAACLIIPEYLTLMTTQSGKFDFDWKFSNYFSVIYMASRSLMDVKAAIFEAHDPNLYCSVGVFLLLPLYWVNKNIRIKEKIGKTLILAIFLISFNTNVPNYVWHGLHFPNSLPARESFIYIFFLLTMCYEGMRGLKEFTNKQLFGAYGCSVALILVIEQMFVNEDYSFKIIYLSLIFLTIYLLLAYSFRKKNAGKNLIIYLMFVAVVTESVINLNDTGISSTNRTAYVQDNEAIDKLVEAADADANTLFYRMEKAERRTKNDQAWHGYKGMSVFSSISLKGVADLYTALGFEESYNSYAYYGATPITSSMFSVKYVLDKEERDDTELQTLVKSVEDKNGSSIFLYKNNYTLPIGFMVDSSIEENWDVASNNPFAVQNSFIMSSCGVADVYTPLQVDENGAEAIISVNEDSDVYVDLVTKSVNKLTATISNADGSIVDTKEFNDMDKPYCVHIGNVTAGQTVQIAGSGDEEISSLQAYGYAFDKEKFKQAYELLNAGGMVVTSFEDSDIKGVVNASNAGLLYTSISYEKGWRAYVDGKEVPTKSLNDSMLTIDVPAGSHDIEFKYMPEGFKTGLAISFASLIILILYIMLGVVRKKKEKGGEIISSEENKELLDEFDIEGLEKNVEADDRANDDEKLLENYIEEETVNNLEDNNSNDNVIKESSDYTAITNDESESIIPNDSHSSTSSSTDGGMSEEERQAIRDVITDKTVSDKVMLDEVRQDINEKADVLKQATADIESIVEANEQAYSVIDKAEDEEMTDTIRNMDEEDLFTFLDEEEDDIDFIDQTK